MAQVEGLNPRGTRWYVRIRAINKPGYRMAKAEVMLLDIIPASVHQKELDLESEEGRDRSRLMVALDAVNGRHGRGTLHVGCTGTFPNASDNAEWFQSAPSSS